MKWAKQNYKGEEYVVPVNRKGALIDGTGPQDGDDILAYYGARASGTFLTLNKTYSHNVGNDVYNMLKKRWPTPPEPNIGAVKRFLKNRNDGQGGSLLNLLKDPIVHDDGWFQFDWKAYSPSKLGENTMNEIWATGKSNQKASWQYSWHGTKLETLYDVMIDG